MSNNYMVSIEEAINSVHTYSSVGDITTLPLLNALDLFLAEDVFSPINMPPFPQSAMDGYAVFYDEYHQNNFTIIDEVKAGDNKKVSLKKGEAVRIFTGAPTPHLANAVIMQEKTTVSNTTLLIKDTLTQNKNIRPQAEQITKGALALAKGTLLNPASIGFLATLGISKVSVYKKPCCTIIVTGNELAKAGQPLQFGQIYESNAIMLQTALLKKGFSDIHIKYVKDDYESTKKSLHTALQQSDFVFISGGISVGDYDFVGKALLDLGTKQLFYKVQQKPGKPLFFGTYQTTSVFALPGNPASALTCFYIYIESALQKFIGNKNYKTQTQQLPLKEEYIKKGSRGEFLKAIATEKEVTILDHQSSAMLNSYSKANALVYLEKETQKVLSQQKVTTYLLD